MTVAFLLHWKGKCAFTYLYGSLFVSILCEPWDVQNGTTVFDWGELGTWNITVLQNGDI